MAVRNKEKIMNSRTHASVFILRRGGTHVEHYGVRERELQWRSHRIKRDIPNLFHIALRIENCCRRK